MTLAIAAIVNCLSLGAGVGEYVDIILARVTTNTTDNISPVVRSGSAKVLINESHARYFHFSQRDCEVISWQRVGPTHH